MVPSLENADKLGKCERTSKDKTTLSVSVINFNRLAVHGVDTKMLRVKAPLPFARSRHLHISWFRGAGSRHILSQWCNNNQVDTENILSEFWQMVLDLKLTEVSAWRLQQQPRQQRQHHLERWEQSLRRMNIRHTHVASHQFHTLKRTYSSTHRN